MSDMIFAFNAVMPVFLIVFLGIVLKRSGMIDDHFVTVSSKLVFNVTIPALIFINIAEADFTAAFRGKLILYAVVAILAAYLLIFFLTYPIRDGRSRGSFIQNSFRSNFAILGFAILFNLFGSEVIAPASVLLSVIMPLFNILSVLALIRFRADGGDMNVPGFLLEVMKNPLVLAALVSIPFSLFNLALPEFLQKGISYLASLTMPLALIGIGGAMSFRGMKRDLGLVIGSSFIKVVFLPLFLTWGAVIAGFRGHDLGMLFVLFASPTAIVSFIMAKAMDSDSLLAANVILVSTLSSIVTLGAGIFLLRYFGLI